jgi:protein kinase C substrate 80K-H
MFYCVNAAFKSTYIPATRVNDQICDCCDGSDEYYVDKACPNTCVEKGRAAREEAAKLAQLVRDGFQKRTEMSIRGREIRKEKEEERSRLEVERQLAETAKEQKLVVKNEMEAPEKEALERYKLLEEEKKKQEEEEEREKTAKEAEEMFNFIDSNEDGLITIEEIKVRNTFDRNKDGVVSDEEATFFLNMETQMTREDFLQSGWLIVKPYFLIEKGMFMPPQPSSLEDPDNQREVAKENPDHVVPEPTSEDYEDDELDDAKENEGYGLDSEVEESEEQGTPDESEKLEPVEEKYDEATRAIIENANLARTEYDKAEKVVRDIAQKLQDINDILNLDFGDDERFAPLHDQCFDFEDREYTYTLCPFKEASQKGKNGGSFVNLGKWGSWSGPENNKYSEMLYEKGQSCWNGPARSAKVIITCGTEHRITGVSEPSRCEYQMELISPVACEKPNDALFEHDEL